MSKRGDKKTPELRFSEFSDHWAFLKLKNVASIQTGLAKGGKDIKEPIKMPYLRVANVQEGYLDLSVVKEIVVEKEKMERYLLQYGDVLLTEGGDFDKLGRGTVWRNQIKNCLHQNHVFVVRPYKKNLLPEYLEEVARSSYGKRYFQLASKQTTNLATINSTQLKDFPVPLPSVGEQSRIIQFLSAIASKIDQLRRKHELLQTYKRGVMQKLFSQEIRFKQDDGSDFPDWEKRKLGELFTIRYGKDHKELKSGEYPVLGTGGVMRYVDAYLYDKPSILIGRKGTIDQPQFITYPFWTVDTLFYSEINSDVVPFFLFLIVQSINWRMYNEATGVPSLNTSSINNVKVVIPSSNGEQERIANFIDSLDQKISTLYKRIDHIKKFKKGLLQKMFV